MRKALLFLIFVVAILASALYYGMYLMDIEDRYGDLQYLYFDSRDGDLIVNNRTGKSGIIQKKNRRIFVIINNRTEHLDEWLDPKNEYVFNVDIYRIDDAENYVSLSNSELLKNLNKNECMSISHLEVKY